MRSFLKSAARAYRSSRSLASARPTIRSRSAGTPRRREPSGPGSRSRIAATLEEVLDHYDALFRRVARLNPPPNLPPIISSDGLVVDRGLVRPEERAALLAYLRKL
jgi:hypothetical protein